MPRIHLGVYLTSGKETVDAVNFALEVKALTITALDISSNNQLTGWLSRVQYSLFALNDRFILMIGQLRFGSNVP